MKASGLSLRCIPLLYWASVHVPSPYAIWYSDVGVLNGSGVAISNGETAGTIQDQSGNGRNVTQATANAQPLYTTAGALNGHNPLVFDGTNDFLQSAALSPTLNLWTAVTVLAPANYEDTVALPMLSIVNSSGLKWALQSGVNLISATPAVVDLPVVLTEVKTATSTGRLLLDGVEISTGTTGNNNLTSQIIGDVGMKFYARLLFSGILTDPQIAAVNASLRSRYAI